MNKLALATAAFSAVLAMSSGAEAGHRSKKAHVILEGTRARVTHVTDGDTFKIYLIADGRKMTSRTLGIDCPEKAANEKCVRENGGLSACLQNEVPLGQRALRAAQFMEGQIITLENDKSSNRFELDQYGRILAYYRRQDGSDYGKGMIEKGYCEDYSQRFHHPREKEYLKAQKKMGKSLKRR